MNHIKIVKPDGERIYDWMCTSEGLEFDFLIGFDSDEETLGNIAELIEAAISQCTLEWEPEWEDGDEPCLECSAKIPFEYALEIWQAPTVRQYDCVLSKSTTGERLRILKRDCVSIEAAKQVAQCWVNEKLNGGESIAGN